MEYTGLYTCHYLFKTNNYEELLMWSKPRLILKKNFAESTENLHAPFLTCDKVMTNMLFAKAVNPG